PQYWELRASAQPFYDLLGEVGIFHTSPAAAAMKIQEVSTSPMSWWSLPAIQEARQRFCEGFARTSPGWLHEWKSELKPFLLRGYEVMNITVNRTNPKESIKPIDQANQQELEGGEQ